MKTKTRKTILLGEGKNFHSLVGKFEMEDTITDYAPIKVKENSLLHHEQREGVWSEEHETLLVDKGNWVLGIQKEYNPFSQSVSRVWD